MALTPLDRAAALNQIRLIATDMDGTLTIANKFTPELLQAFEKLAQAGIELLIVTGRSAGWVNGLAHYLPIAGAIAENGGLFYQHDQQILLTPIATLHQHRQKLSEMFERLRSHFPHLRESSDNAFRLTDWTFDVAGLRVEDLDRMTALCQTQGWNFTYSNVQCHILPLQQNKAAGLINVLNAHFPQYERDQVATVGDSPNDESLFDASVFPVSIGVANVRHYQTQLAHLPAYITAKAEGAGFCELVSQLIT